MRSHLPGLLLLGAWPVAVEARLTPACAARVVAEVDRASFANNGAAIVFPPDTLVRFERQIEAAFLAAAAEVPPAGCRRLRAVRTLRIVTASGADEPVLLPSRFADELALEWAFAEAELAVPPAADLAAALRRWARAR